VTVTVHFQVDADGLLQVTAKDDTTGHAANITVKPYFGMNEQTVNALIEEAATHADDDKIAKATQEKNNFAKQINHVFEGGN